MAITKDFQKFSPRAYLKEHYDGRALETDFILHFLHETYRRHGKKNFSILELGGGATLYQLISASKYAKRIVFTDYLEKNLVEVRAWLKAEKNAFSWASYIKKVAGLEGTSSASIEKRLRRAVQQVRAFDVLHPDRSFGEEKFDVVSSHFCAESITDNKKEFEKAVRTIVSFLKPGGLLVMSLLKNFESYEDGVREFPAYPVDEKAFRSLLKKLGFKDIEIQTVDVEEDIDDPYANMCVRAYKK